VFSWSTWIRAEQWSDNVSHAIIEAIHHPESPRAVFSAGRIHARLAINGHTESSDRAFSYLQQASELNDSGILPEVVMIKLAHILDVPVKDAWYKKIIEKLELPISAADLNALHILGQCQQGICDTPRSTMEAIYQTALNNDSLSGARRRAHAYTSYGYYLINGEGEFKQGRNYFIKAVETSPGELQNWINLLKLLLTMKNFDSAEKWLNEFRSTNIPGATDKDYLRFQKSIQKGRLQLTSEQVTAETGISTGN
jgi:tetratricopeptide (TPR) repeat protein